jgi:FkbM family methyltransferase
VIAFEPSLENAHIAQANAAANGMGNVTVVAGALADTDGWLSFVAEGSLEGRLELYDPNPGAERPAVGGRGRLRTLVPVASLDSWLGLTGQPAPTLVKIDVEGAEVGVLRGMVNTLASARPSLIIELHGTREEVADLLDAAGYEHRAIEVDVPTRQAPWWAHVLARPAR